MKFTDDPYVKETLRFLMTREVAHFQQFEAALSTIQPNFPPAVLQSDPRYSNLYFNMSSGQEARGPWNEGPSSQLGETWQYIEDPLQHVPATNGLTDVKPEGTKRTEKTVEKANKALSKERSTEVKSATPEKDIQWSTYSETKGDKSTKKSK
jgi:Mn-containing catalase